jgi:hypothetical protein
MYVLLYIFGCQLSSAAEISPNISFQWACKFRAPLNSDVGPQNNEDLNTHRAHRRFFDYDSTGCTELSE